MRDDLVPEEVEIDPVSRGTTLPTTEQIAIKGAGFCKVPDGEGEVEAGSRHVEQLWRVRRERSKARG